jgi:hypothetical protein
LGVEEASGKKNLADILSAVSCLTPNSKKMLVQQLDIAK